jgi:hypothetical protein
MIADTIYYMIDFFLLNYFRNTSLIITIGLLGFIIGPLAIYTVLSEGTVLYFNVHLALAQQQQSAPNNNHNNNNNSTLKNNQTIHVIAQASGRFANNQIKDGIVTWIQGGLWNLQIQSLPYNNITNNTTEIHIGKPKITAAFNANFTMIKPDGSFSHNHTINNFSSKYVFMTKNDIVVIGIADIHSDIGLEFKQVPITVHLMGKKVLGMTINVNKSNGHFASSNEMFGTLVSGIGLTGKGFNNTTTNASNDKILVQLSNEHK